MDFDSFAWYGIFKQNWGTFYHEIYHAVATVALSFKMHLGMIKKLQRVVTQLTRGPSFLDYNTMGNIPRGDGNGVARENQMNIVYKRAL